MIGACLFLLRLALPADRTAVIAARTGFLLSAFLFALLSMQSGLVRSDNNHIVFGVYPMVFFAGVVLFSFQSLTVSMIAALAAVVCSVAFSQPAPHFQRASLRFRLARMLHPITTCPGGYREFDHACYPWNLPTPWKLPSAIFTSNSGENDSVVIFPVPIHVRRGGAAQCGCRG